MKDARDSSKDLFADLPFINAEVFLNVKSAKVCAIGVSHADWPNVMQWECQEKV